MFKYVVEHQFNMSQLNFTVLIIEAYNRGDTSVKGWCSREIYQWEQRKITGYPCADWRLAMNLTKQPLDVMIDSTLYIIILQSILQNNSICSGDCIHTVLSRHCQSDSFWIVALSLVYLCCPSYSHTNSREDIWSAQELRITGTRWAFNLVDTILWLILKSLSQCLNGLPRKTTSSHRIWQEDSLQGEIS